MWIETVCDLFVQFCVCMRYYNGVRERTVLFISCHFITSYIPWQLDCWSILFNANASYIQYTNVMVSGFRVRKKTQIYNYYSIMHSSFCLTVNFLFDLSFFFLSYLLSYQVHKNRFFIFRKIHTSTTHTIHLYHTSTHLRHATTNTQWVIKTFIWQDDNDDDCD